MTMDEVTINAPLFGLPELQPAKRSVNSAVNPDVYVALSRIAANYKRYQFYTNYYEGIQPMMYSSDKFNTTFSRQVAKYTENMCATVVDSLSDRLVVVGFEVEGSDQDASGKALWNLWELNHMALQSGEVHTNAIRDGDSYVIVWPDDETGVDIAPQEARNMTVMYEDDSKRIAWAAKWWMRDDKYVRLNLYYSDRIEKYVSAGVSQSRQPNVRVRMTLLEEEGVENPVANPYGRVPVFHFANNKLFKPGRSDLHDVTPIQDALNKSVCDMLVSQEYNAFQQRWATGIEVNMNPTTGKMEPAFKPGADHLWFSESKDTTFGQFEQGVLSEFIHSHDMHVLSIARVTHTPTHYMLVDPANFPSGESLKTAEAPFTAKIIDRQNAFGAVWEDVMNFAAKIVSIPVSTRVKAHWQDAAPRSDYDFAQTAVLKKQFGVSNKQLQREGGYSEEEIEQMSKEKEEETEASLQANMAALNRGANPVAPPPNGDK